MTKKTGQVTCFTLLFRGAAFYQKFKLFLYSKLISLKEWKRRRNESLTSNGDGGGGDDDGYCQVKQEQLLSRMLMPILLTRSGLMGTWQFNQFAKKFNTDVAQHNAECPKRQVQPFTFL